MKALNDVSEQVLLTDTKALTLRCFSCKKKEQYLPGHRKRKHGSYNFEGRKNEKWLHTCFKSGRSGHTVRDCKDFDHVDGPDTA